MLLLDETGDLAVLGGDSRREIDHEEADISPANRALRPHGGEDFHRAVHAGPLAQPGGIDEGVAFPGAIVRDVDRVASGARHFGHDGPLIVENGVDEGGFSGIRFSDHRDLEARLLGVLLGLAGRFRKWAEARIQFREQFPEVAAVGCGHGDSGAESESREVPRDMIEVLVVGLVENEADLLGGLAELLGDDLIDRGEAFAGIDEEKDEIGGVHRDLRLGAHRLGEVLIGHRANATRVDQVAGNGGEGAGGGDPVAGHPRLVVHDRDGASGQTVEEGRLADVGAAHQGHHGPTNPAGHGRGGGVARCPAGC